MMKRTIFSMIGLVCLALLIVPTARTGWSSTEAEKPAADGREVVEKLQSALLDAMKDGPRLGFKGRHDFLDPVIRKVFSLRTGIDFHPRVNWRVVCFFFRL